jgi:hypothetical protein
MREPAELPKGEDCRLQFSTPVSGPTHHYQGWMRVAVYESGIYCQWDDADRRWYQVTWWELAHFAHVTPPKLRDELEELRDEARGLGMLDAIEDFKKNPEVWMNERKPPARS